MGGEPVNFTRFPYKAPMPMEEITTPPTKGPPPPVLPDGYAGRDLRLSNPESYFQPQPRPQVEPSTKVALPRPNLWSSVSRWLSAGTAFVARQFVASPAALFGGALGIFVSGPAPFVGKGTSHSLDFRPQGITLSEAEHMAIMAQIERSPGDRILWEIGWNDRHIVEIILANHRAQRTAPVPMWPNIQIPPNISKEEIVRYKLPGIQSGFAVFPGEKKEGLTEPNPPDGPVYFPGAFADEVSDPKPESSRYFLVDSGPSEEDQHLRLLEYARKGLGIIEGFKSDHGLDVVMEYVNIRLLNKLFRLQDALRDAGDINPALKDVYRQLEEQIDEIVTHPKFFETIGKEIERFVKKQKSESLGNRIQKMILKLIGRDSFYKDDQIKFVLGRLAARGFDVRYLESIMAPHSLHLKN